MLPAVGQDLDEMDALVARLPADLSRARQRGYVHQAELEKQVRDLIGRWDTISERVSEALFQRQTDLVEGANRLLDTVDRLYEPGASRATVDGCWAGVQALQSRIEAAHKSLTGMYDDVSRDLEQIEGALDRVEWMLDQIESSSFQLLPGEGPLRAASARWVRQGVEGDPLGLLYLTDQRIVFEQKEERTTEKFLFIKLKTAQIHEFMFDVPVNALQEVRVGKGRDGFLGLGSVDTLEMWFDHTAGLRDALFQMQKDDAAAWQQLIGRVKSSDIDRARTQEATAEAEALDQARAEIPANCPNCTAPLDTIWHRGMTDVTCRYCGTVHRLGS